MIDYRYLSPFILGTVVGLNFSFLYSRYKANLTASCKLDDNFKREDEIKKRMPLELRNELLSRVISFFGEEKFSKISQSFVIVVGK